MYSILWVTIWRRAWIFSQIMDFVPTYEFKKCVKRYKGDYRIRNFTYWNQFLCLAFAQLIYRESLRDIESCLNSIPQKLYHMGFRGNITRSTLADANEKETGESMPILLRSLSARPDLFTGMMNLALSWIIRYMPLIQRQ